MMKWLLIAVAVLVLYKLFMNERGKKNVDDKKVRDKKVAAGEMVKDPVCGSYVEIDGSITVRDGHKIHRFCSYECREKYLEQLESSGRELPLRDKKDD